MKMFSLRTLGSIRHGGRQEIAMFGNKTSVWQCCARSLPWCHKEEQQHHSRSTHWQTDTSLRGSELMFTEGNDKELVLHNVRKQKQNKYRITSNIPLMSWTQPMSIIIMSARTLATVKTYWTQLAQLTLQQLMNVNNTNTHTTTITLTGHS